MSAQNYFQLYDEQGRPTDDRVDLPTVGREGLLHGVAHIWVWRRSGDTIEVLLQKRSSTILTYPGLFDISAAGHLDYGDTPIEAAVRETGEELGIVPEISRLWHIGVVRSNMLATSDPKIIENEFQWLYLYELLEGETIQAEPGELDGVKWVSFDELVDMTRDPAVNNLVPHDAEYYSSILRSLAQAGRL